MSHRQSVHDLKSLIRSFHSMIAIETIEEDRVRAILAEVASDLNMPLYEWSVTSGFKRGYGLAIGNTSEPFAMLEYLREIKGEGIFMLKDLAPHLSRPETARAFREVVQKMTHSHATLVITGEPVELPRDLEAITARFALGFPDENERRQAVRAVVESMKARQPVRVDLTRDDVHGILQSLAGLTLHQVRRVIAQAIVADGMLSRDDIERIVQWKGEIIEKGGMLEFIPPDGNLVELGGFERLKQWLDRAKIGFTPEAKAMNLRPPKGVLFVGVQGCGKSLAAKFIARQWQLPLLKLDAGRLYDKYVGESEKNFRRATEMAEAMAPIVLWIFVDLPTAAERERIIAIHVAARRQDPACVDAVAAANESEGYSGAELEQCVIAALYRALHLRQPLSTQLLLESIRAIVPLSVSRREDIAELRRSAMGRFTPV